MSGVESNGPDQVRGNIGCKDFHDSVGRFPTGSESWEIGGAHYNCCCCDPCRFVRPHGDQTDAPGMRNFCCRCVPRLLMLLFVPNDPDEECCKTVGVHMIHQQVPNQYASKYKGTLFGVNVEIRVGKVIGAEYGYEYDYGYGDDAACGWTATATSASQTIGSSTYQEFEIDDVYEDCLTVPDTIELGEIEGPAGCYGKLVVRDVYKARLPFHPRDDTSYADGGNFQDLTYEPWGPFTEVCSRICARGDRHCDNTFPRAEFEWFDESEGVPQNPDAQYRGWEYYNYNTSNLERIYAVTDEYGNAWLVPDLEPGAEKYDPIMVDEYDMVSCKLNQLFTTTYEAQGHSFRIRCGACTCWDFFCATCRCVPYELCLMYWDGEMHTDVQLLWNPSIHAWESDGEYDDVQFILREDERGRCIIVPAFNGVELEMVAYPVHDCGEETWTNEFTGKHDVLTASGYGTITDSEYGEQKIWFSAESLKPSCIPTPCTATPCSEECGGDPESLMVTIHEWNEDGDYSGPPGYAVTSCTLEVQVYRNETFNVWGANGPEFMCGYVGFIALSCGDCIMQVTVFGTEVYFGLLELDCWESDPFQRGSVILNSISCTPYYGETDEMGPIPNGSILKGCYRLIGEQCCSSCDYPPLRGQVFVSEV